LFLLTLWACSIGWAAEAPAAPEYKVKAGYLANFVRYVDWPAESFASTNSPVQIGVLDAGEALVSLQKLLQNKKVEGHPLSVNPVTFDQIGKSNGLHLLFVTRQAGKSAEELRNALGASPILLVGETEQFAERGGVIGFVHEEDSVRLTLCLEHATEKRLKISSKLAAVAKSVRSKVKK
jgi:hypothetical protein